MQQLYFYLGLCTVQNSTFSVVLHYSYLGLKRLYQLLGKRSIIPYQSSNRYVIDYSLGILSPKSTENPRFVKFESVSAVCMKLPGAWCIF